MAPAETTTSPFQPVKENWKGGHFSQFQLHLAREPWTPVDRGNEFFFRMERAYS
jgi:hypothetical protein